MKLVKNVLTILTLIIAILILTSSNINAKTLTVNTDTLKLRKEASTDSTIIELLNYGEKLEYIEESGDWYKVKIKGMTGYVHKDYVKEQQESTSTNNLIENTVTSENNTVNNNTTNTTENNTITNNEATNNTTENNVVPEIENTIQTNSEPTQIEIKEMKVSKDSNIYILPLINANIIQNIKKDSNVTIISKTNGWAYVETDEVMGWIRQDVLIDSTVVSDDINTDEPNNNEPQNGETQNEKPQENADTQITAKTMYINTTSVYVRKGPSTEQEVVDSLILNNAVKVIAENGDWYKVEVSGKTGYIAKRLLSDKQITTTSRGKIEREGQQKLENDKKVDSENAQTSKGEQIVEYAKQYLGCKYVYGSSGPNTFDCSGFTMYVFRNFGITLNHSATGQSKVGTYVEKENLVPGDLVFFTDYETGNGIGHCGIYIGDGNFIHASSGTGYCVKISTLTSGSYLKRYETARRLAQ